METAVSRGGVGRGVRLAVSAGVIVLVFLLTSMRSRQPEPSFEATAISRVRAVITAQIAYASLCGGYAESLEELSRPSCKPNAADSTRLLSPDIVANRETSAYRFELVPGADVASRYAYIAVPTQMHGRTMHAFCGDDSGRIYVEVRGVRPVVRDGQCQDRGTLVSMGAANGT